MSICPVVQVTHTVQAGGFLPELLPAWTHYQGVSFLLPFLFGAMLAFLAYIPSSPVSLLWALVNRLLFFVCLFLIHDTRFGCHFNLFHGNIFLLNAVYHFFFLLFSFCLGKLHRRSVLVPWGRWVLLGRVIYRKFVWERTGVVSDASRTEINKRSLFINKHKGSWMWTPRPWQHKPSRLIFQPAPCLHIQPPTPSRQISPNDCVLICNRTTFFPQLFYGKLCNVSLITMEFCYLK